MKRAYADLPERTRRERAADEAYFDLPGGPTRLDVLCVLQVNGLRRIPITEACPAARRWLTDRGITG